MKFDEALGKAYVKLLATTTNTDTPIYGGKTSEDLLNDCVITMHNLYKDKEEVEYEDVFSNFERVFLERVYFAYHKKTEKKHNFLIFIPQYPDNI